MKVYFDISDIVEYARYNERVSGIQRFSLRIISNALAIRRDPQPGIISWMPEAADVVELDASWCVPDFDFRGSEFLRRVSPGSTRGSRGRQSGRVSHLWHFLKGNHRWFAKRGLLAPPSAFAALFGFTPIAADGAATRAAAPIATRPFRPEPGDVIALLGANWNFPAYQRRIAELKGSGVKIAVFVHDLIPLKVPEHVGDGVTERFARWIGESVRAADILICNSEATERDVAAYLSEHDAATPTKVVKLAHEFVETPRDDTAQIRAEVRSKTRLPYALFVGTRESRKNCWGLLRAWDAVAQRVGLNAPRLIMAGKPGEFIDDFEAAFTATGGLGGRVLLIDGATDRELSHLYRNCMFTALPSFYEGWGLPIGESLWFGKPCVTSSVSSMPEVGGSHCLYVDPYDVEALADALCEMIQNTELRERLGGSISRADLRKWADVSEDLLASLNGL